MVLTGWIMTGLLVLFMLGASAESNARACANLRRRYRGLQIVGSQDGFFDDPMAVVDQINASRAQVLFVAMGSPTQEYWISSHREMLDVSFCMGVGGSFDVASGVSRRAPAMFRKTGTEWLYQLMTQPHRRFRRQLIYVPFMLRVIAKRLSGTNGKTVWAVEPRKCSTSTPRATVGAHESSRS